MKCNKSTRIASAHLDRQLTQNEATAYRAHIDTCTGCRAYLAELEQVSLLLKSAGRPVTPPELRSYIMSVITAEYPWGIWVYPPGAGG